MTGIAGRCSRSSGCRLPTARCSPCATCRCSVAPGIDRHGDRAERRGQDDAAGGDRRTAAGARRRPLLRPRARLVAGRGARCARRRARPREARAVRVDERRRQPAARRIRAAARAPAIARCSAEVYARFPRLAERRDQLAGTLSGGERQMLALGRALMAAPQGAAARRAVARSRAARRARHLRDHRGIARKRRRRPARRTERTGCAADRRLRLRARNRRVAFEGPSRELASQSAGCRDLSWTRQQGARRRRPYAGAAAR